MFQRARRADDAEGTAADMQIEDDRLGTILERVRKVRHDVNGPLTVALGHVHLLLENGAALDAEVLDGLRTVESELRRLIQILRGLDGLAGTGAGAAPSA